MAIETPAPKIPTNGTKNMRELGSRAATSGGIDMTAPEACLWVRTSDMATGRGNWKGNNSRRTKNGIERLPQLAHLPGDHTNRVVHPRAATRYRKVIDQHGAEITQMLSNAAAHLPVIEHGRYSRDEHAQYQLDKARGLGWIPTGCGCLKRMVADGLVLADRLLVSLDGAKVCPKDAATCKHLELERAARKSKNDKRMAAIEEQYKSDQTRRDEDQTTVLTAIKALLEQQKASK